MSANSKSTPNNKIRSDDGYEPLDIPLWVPSEVAEFARFAYENAIRRHTSEGVVVAALVERLATDARMQAVWAQLQKKKRHRYKPTDVFLYRVRSEAKVVGTIADPMKRQMDAMLWLFSAVVVLSLPHDHAAVAPSPPPQSREWASFAPKLRKQADRFRAAGEDKLAHLLEATLEGRERIHALEDLGPIFARQIRGNKQVQFFARAVARLCRDLFGDFMYGTVSWLVSVALDRNITGHMIREWCRSLE
jgi:hypothetical protein